MIIRSSSKFAITIPKQFPGNSTSAQGLLRLRMSTGIPNPKTDEQTLVPNTTASPEQQSGLSTQTGSVARELAIESDDYVTGAGVELSAQQKVLVGSVLDLFAGKPTLKKLSLWTDDATFDDPLTKSAGRRQFSAQWYGLVAAFSEITRLAPAQVTSAGNPITMYIKTKYKVKGLGTEKTIESVVKIFTDADGQKIVGVQDRWNGNIPEGVIATAFRSLNAVAVPAFVSVPKSEEEGKKQ